MKPLPYQASTHEQQLAMAILAHAARDDGDALTASLDLLADPSEDLHPIYVIAALITEFQRGMDLRDNDKLAEWFAGQALILAADESGQ